EDVLSALVRLEGSLRTQGPEGRTRAAPLLHDASLARFTGAESVLGFDVSAASLMPHPHDTLGPAPALPSLGAERPKRIGDYDIIEELGRGGMGIVYKAQDRRLLRVVALKILGAGFFADKPLLLRFRREAQAAATLQHPNIVQVFDIGEHE